MKKIKKFILLSMPLAALAVMFGAIVAFSNPSPANAAGQCVTTNLRAYDRGGGTYWNRNFVIDVYGTNKSSGYFLYYNPVKSSWYSIRWSPHYLINNNTGVRFGVSTSWAYVNYWWKSTAWRYVYPC